MSNVTLKRSSREAQSFSDESNGRPSSVYEVIKSLAENPPFTVKAHLAVIATGILTTAYTEKATRLRKLWTRAAVCGTAGSTTVQVLVNGVLATGATATIANTDTDGALVETDLDVAVPAGARIDLSVSAAPTAGTGLSVQADFNALTVES